MTGIVAGRGRTVFLLALGALLVIGLVASALRGTPTRTEQFISDDAGRSIVQHGFSLANSAKGSPDGLPVFTEEQLDQEHADMGTNFVRFLISWKSVEPSPGVYDQQYLDGVEAQVQWYAERGYRVMLDMHQDLWGPAISDTLPHGWANGAPAWATYLDGLRVSGNDMWELIYLESGVIRAFDHFWNTSGEHPELMEHYAQSWRAVAERFRGNDAVIAYDLMNEPYGGSLQGVAFESGPLTSLYQRTADAIREVDDDTWVCLEPQALGFNWGLPSALGAVDDARQGDPHVAFCPHLYPLPMDLGDGYVGFSRTMIDGTVAAWTDNVLRTASVLGQGSGPVPVILGEFGLNTDGEGAEEYVRLVYQTADAHGFGVAYWSRDNGSWGPYEDDGSARNLVTWLNRPYPRAVEGLQSWSSDADSLSVSMKPEGNATVYLPATRVLSQPLLAGGTLVSWDADTGTLELVAGATGEVIVSAR